MTQKHFCPYFCQILAIYKIHSLAHCWTKMLCLHNNTVC